MDAMASRPTTRISSFSVFKVKQLLCFESSWFSEATMQLLNNVYVLHSKCWCESIKLANRTIFTQFSWTFIHVSSGKIYQVTSRPEIVIAKSIGVQFFLCITGCICCLVFSSYITALANHSVRLRWNRPIWNCRYRLVSNEYLVTTP